LCFLWGGGGGWGVVALGFPPPFAPPPPPPALLEQAHDPGCTLICTEKLQAVDGNCIILAEVDYAKSFC
jgi:hypothetical protein